MSKADSALGLSHQVYALWGDSTCSQSSLLISAILYAALHCILAKLKIQMPMTHCIALSQEAEGHRWQSL